MSALSACSTTFEVDASLRVIREYRYGYTYYSLVFSEEVPRDATFNVWISGAGSLVEPFVQNQRFEVNDMGAIASFSVYRVSDNKMPFTPECEAGWREDDLRYTINLELSSGAQELYSTVIDDSVSGYVSKYPRCS